MIQVTGVTPSRILYTREKVRAWCAQDEATRRVEFWFLERPAALLGPMRRVARSLVQALAAGHGRAVRPPAANGAPARQLPRRVKSGAHWRGKLGGLGHLARLEVRLQLGERAGKPDKALRSSNAREKLDGLKRLIGVMSTGRDVSTFFAAVVMNLAQDSFDVKVLVYIYLVRTAEQKAADARAASRRRA